MRPQPSMARCIEARFVRSPSTTSAPSRRRASARWSSRRTMARTLCPLASRNSVRLRPMPPTAPAAPVTRIGLSYLCFVVMSLTLGYFKNELATRRGVRIESRPTKLKVNIVGPPVSPRKLDQASVTSTTAWANAFGSRGEQGSDVDEAIDVVGDLFFNDTATTES